MIYQDRIPSPIGPLFLSGDDLGLKSLDFLAPATAEPRAQRSPAYWEKLREQLTGYFSGTTQRFDLPFALSGPSFYLRVWGALLTIPFGETIPYKELARRAGNPQAFRAAGQANHHNPLPLIIPCHRVIQSDGKIGGYGGGVEIKKWLLEHESTVGAGQTHDFLSSRGGAGRGTPKSR